MASTTSIPDDTAGLLHAQGVSQYFDAQGTKLLCKLNGHCLPLDNTAQVSAFIRGKKFLKLVHLEEERSQLKKLEPFLIPSTRVKGYLFCALTKQLIRAHPDTARQHMQGSKFLRSKERFMEDAIDLAEEPADGAKPGRRRERQQQQDEDGRESGAGDREGSDACSGSSGASSDDGAAGGSADEAAPSGDEGATSECDADSADVAAADGSTLSVSQQLQKRVMEEKASKRALRKEVKRKHAEARRAERQRRQADSQPRRSTVRKREDAAKTRPSKKAKASL